MVSIILPTKNSIRFLKERVDSIREQTYADYEVIIIDTASTDGTLEYLQSWADADERVHIFSAPPGLYQAFNLGIQKAHGEFVYIATSDDTMSSVALEHMVAAMNAHPDCDICDSRARNIDESGADIECSSSLYKYNTGHFTFPINAACIRRPPYDLLTYCGGKPVYMTVTQILIRKKLFERSGFYPTDCGAAGDFLWGMRAALSASVVYLPDYLGTWRVHEDQATGHEKSFSDYWLLYKMIMSVIRGISDPNLAHAAKKAARIADFKCRLLAVKRRGSILKRVTGVISAMVWHPYWTCWLISGAFCQKRKGFDYPSIVAFNCLYRSVLNQIYQEYHYDRCLISYL